ncbi:MAG: prevent-host-death protein [Propionibacteriaceae bacterium]|jgi:antitoxin (DNA-binding transcriptional repressor) of toxin-antitoxin stability system|nr:prevent-host-death protein [Propionibacteriaceae bacterium]
MDAVERGQSFTVTRDGRPMGQLVPLQRRFVRREQFSTTSATAATVDLAGFRADQDKALDTGWDDAFTR